MRRNFMQIFMTGAFGALSIAAAVAAIWSAIWFPVALTLGGFAVASWIDGEEEEA